MYVDRLHHVDVRGSHHKLARPSWVVAPVGGALVLGVIAGVFLATGNQHPGWALSSNLVYRMAFGALLAATVYLVSITLMLAWRGQVFSKVTVGAVGVEAPALQAAAKQLDDFALKADAGAGRLRAELDDVAASVDKLMYGLGLALRSVAEFRETDKELAESNATLATELAHLMETVKNIADTDNENDDAFDDALKSLTARIDVLQASAGVEHNNGGPASERGGAKVA